MKVSALFFETSVSVYNVDVALLSFETSVGVYHEDVALIFRNIGVYHLTRRKNQDLHISLRCWHYPSSGYYPEPEESLPLTQVLCKFHVADHLLDLVCEILQRKAGSESLVHRKRRRIGGRNKTNTPTPCHWTLQVENRPFASSTRFFTG